MTKEEFQNKFNNYSVSTYMDAFSDSVKVNHKALNFKCVPVKIGDKYCLMLEEAALLISELGII